MSSSFAQQENQANTDTTTIAKKVKKPKEKVKFTPIHLRVGVDLWALGNNLRNPNKLLFSGNTEVSFNNVLFGVVEGGYGDAFVSKLTPNAFQYQNTGYFVKAGLEYNVLHRMLDNEAVVVGLRYGFSSFDHRLSYDVDDRYWDFEGVENSRTRYFRSISEDGLSFQWAEVVAGMKANLAREGWASHLYMSYLFRLQIRTQSPENVLAKPTEIAGFGKNQNATNIGFSYFISYEF